MYLQSSISSTLKSLMSLNNFPVFSLFAAFAIIITVAIISVVSLLRTLRCGDYGLRTTAGSHFQDWDETRVFSHPTVASSRRCVVEGFYVVWKGGLRIHHKGMKKQFKARKLRNSCCLTLELQTNARLEQLQELVNSVLRKMHR